MIEKMCCYIRLFFDWIVGNLIRLVFKGFFLSIYFYKKGMFVVKKILQQTIFTKMP